MMREALRDAGFLGIEAEGASLYARLPDGITPFRAEPEGGDWVLTLSWPIRAGAAQMAEWNASHPQSPMDLHQGEARISFRTDGQPASLLLWTALAEEAMAQLIRWRRAQRAPGEGF